MLVVDGLDEASEKEQAQFIGCLADIVSQQTLNLRIQVAIFARPDVRANGELHLGQQERIIEVTQEKNAQDIDTFVKEKLGQIPLLKKMKSLNFILQYQSLAKEIYTSVKTRSQGMFLWASLVFDQINRDHSPEAIRESLRSAPKGLDDMLHHVFKRLDTAEEARSSCLKYLLYWISYSYRPFTIAELFILLRFSTGHEYLMIEEDLRFRYSSLFSVTSFSARDTKEQSDDPQDPVPFVDRTSIVHLDDLDFLENGSVRDTTHTLRSLSNDSENGKSWKCHYITTPAGQRENEKFELPLRWYSNVVNVTHARINDYVHAEMDPRRRKWHDCPIFADTTNDVKAHLLKICLTAMYTGTIYEYGATRLVNYIRARWIAYLTDVRLDQGSQTAVDIANLLLKFFTDTHSIRASLSTMANYFEQVWFCQTTYTNSVRRILTENLPYVDNTMHPWILEIGTSFKALFHPLVKECSLQWLTAKTVLDSQSYLQLPQAEIRFLCAFSTLVGAFRPKHHDKILINSQSDKGCDPDVMRGMEYPSVNVIEGAAGLAGLPRTEHWYTGVAWAMIGTRGIAHARRAVEHLNKALEMAPDDCRALLGLAYCHGDCFADHKTAMIFADKAIAVATDESALKRSLDSTLKNWQLRLGEPKKAVAAARSAYERAIGSVEWYYNQVVAHDMLTTIQCSLEVLYRAEHFADMLQVIEEMSTHFAIDSANLWHFFLINQWSNFYNANIFEKIGRLHHSGRFDHAARFITDHIEEAANMKLEIGKEQNKWLARTGATWLYHCGFRDQCRSWLSDVIEIINDSDDLIRVQAYDLLHTASAILSSIYLDEAIQAKIAGEDPAPFVSSIRDLIFDQKTHVLEYANLRLGLWMHEYGHEDEATWMAAFRSSIVTALKHIGRGDIWSDLGVYIALGTSLLLAKEIDNARIALGIAMRPLEKITMARRNGKPQHDPTPDLSQLDTLTNTGQVISGQHTRPESMTFRCDGICDTAEDAYQELYFCCICHDTCFCEECILLVRDDKLQQLCSAKHDLVCVYPVTGRARQIVDGLIEDRREEYTLWLDELRRMWDTPQ